LIACARTLASIVLLAVVNLTSACSVQRFATNRLADALAASGTTYSSDDDPELVGAALPFSLKLMETALAATPDHRALLAATSAGFAQYAYAYVQQEGDELGLEDSDRAWSALDRARRLYLRARDYGLRGLEVALPGFGEELRSSHAGAVARAGPPEVDLLYWTAVSWAAAVSLGKDDPALVAELPIVSALIERALAVDEDWDRGAIHAFLVTFEMSRPDAGVDRYADAKRHFERAVELTQGRAAAPHVAWAESACISAEDRACFEQALAAALRIDADVDPASRLVNLIMQRRARWLLANADRWILPPLPEEPDTEAPEG
jgi:predicted anti-sigma-YlaC factor YlaD